MSPRAWASPSGATRPGAGGAAAEGTPEADEASLLLPPTLPTEPPVRRLSLEAEARFRGER